MPHLGPASMLQSQTTPLWPSQARPPQDLKHMHPTRAPAAPDPPPSCTWGGAAPGAAPLGRAQTAGGREEEGTAAGGGQGEAASLCPWKRAEQSPALRAPTLQPPAKCGAGQNRVRGRGEGTAGRWPHLALGAIAAGADLLPGAAQLRLQQGWGGGGVRWGVGGQDDLGWGRGRRREAKGQLQAECAAGRAWQVGLPVEHVQAGRQQPQPPAGEQH